MEENMEVTKEETTIHTYTAKISRGDLLALLNFDNPIDDAPKSIEVSVPVVGGDVEELPFDIDSAIHVKIVWKETKEVDDG